MVIPIQYSGLSSRGLHRIICFLLEHECVDITTTKSKTYEVFKTGEIQCTPT